MTFVTASGKFLFYGTLTIVLSLTLPVSCLFPLISDQPAEPLQFSIAGNNGDTISPFGPLSVCFSSPVKNTDSARFIFTPSFTEYQVIWSDSRDTAVFHFAQPLDGNAAYRVQLADRTESEDGSFFFPWNDTLKLFTWFCEEEPNGSLNLADILHGIVFGHVTMANDTDWFAVSDTTRRSFYLKSTVSTSLFTIRDSRGMTVSPGAYAAAETLSAPMDFVPPFHLMVYPCNQSNGGSYELGWTGSFRQ